jgi:hypothetical protein
LQSFACMANHSMTPPAQGHSGVLYLLPERTYFMVISLKKFWCSSSSADAAYNSNYQSLSYGQSRHLNQGNQYEYDGLSFRDCSI